VIVRSPLVPPHFFPFGRRPSAIILLLAPVWSLVFYVIFLVCLANLCWYFPLFFSLRRHPSGFSFPLSFSQRAVSFTESLKVNESLSICSFTPLPAPRLRRPSSLCVSQLRRFSYFLMQSFKIAQTYFPFFFLCVEDLSISTHLRAGPPFGLRRLLFGSPPPPILSLRFLVFLFYPGKGGTLFLRNPPLHGLFSEVCCSG